MVDFDRIVSANSLDNDESVAVEINTRPKNFANYIGQHTVKEQMQVFIAAAKKRKESLDHTLLYGPAGLGKTTLASIIANEMEAEIKITAAPMITRPADLAAIISGLLPHSILLIDEIHRLPPAVEESLYPAMEDYRLDILVGEGAGAKSIKIDVPPFTLVGATTRSGLLTAPLRDRFGIMQHLQFYSNADLAKIIVRLSGLLNCPITADGAHEIATRSRGTPRIANKLLRRVRDYAEVQNTNKIDKNLANIALTKLSIDKFGLDNLDRAFLEVIINNFSGGPVGIKSIAATINEEILTVEDVIEPFLMQENFVQRTPAGRIATQKSYDLLGISRT